MTYLRHTQIMVIMVHGFGTWGDLMWQWEETRSVRNQRGTFIFSIKVYIGRADQRRVSALSKNSVGFVGFEGLWPQHFGIFLPPPLPYFRGNPCLLKRPQLPEKSPIKTYHFCDSPCFPSPRCVAGGVPYFKQVWKSHREGGAIMTICLQWEAHEFVQ